MTPRQRRPAEQHRTPPPIERILRDVRDVRQIAGNLEGLMQAAYDFAYTQGGGAGNGKVIVGKSNPTMDVFLDERRAEVRGSLATAERALRRIYNDIDAQEKALHKAFGGARLTPVPLEQFVRAGQAGMPGTTVNDIVEAHQARARRRTRGDL